MSDSQASARDEQVKDREPNGRFPPGVSGNPAGGAVLSGRAERLYAEISAEMGSLTALQRAMLAQATKMLARAQSTRNPKAAVPLFNAGMRALATIHNGMKPLSKPRTVTTGLAASFTDVATQAQTDAAGRRARELAEDDPE
jgi:hypothetical protein